MHALNESIYVQFVVAVINWAPCVECLVCYCCYYCHFSSAVHYFSMLFDSMLMSVFAFVCRRFVVVCPRFDSACVAKKLSCPNGTNPTNDLMLTEWMAWMSEWVCRWFGCYRCFTVSIRHSYSKHKQQEPGKCTIYIQILCSYECLPWHKQFNNNKITEKLYCWWWLLLLLFVYMLNNAQKYAHSSNMHFKSV